MHQHWTNLDRIVDLNAPANVSVGTVTQPALLLRVEGFNLFNHGNILGRAQTIYGDTE